MSPESLSAALRVNPFEGDFGNPSDRTIRDRIVKTRKEGPCHHCSETILKGTFARSRTELFDGQIESYRWCQKCTELMARIDDDGAEEELEDRFNKLLR